MATATSLITAAFQDLGVYQPGETVTSTDLNTGLERLNRLVSTWRTMDLTVLAVERMIFSLTANQQQYSIGPGGDFDVARPQQVNGAALLLNGLSAAQSITLTRSGDVATATLTAHGYDVGQEVIIAGATEIAYNGEVIIASTPTSDTFTYAVFGEPTTPATGSPTVAAYNGVPVEIPRSLLTDDAYQAIQVKTLTNSQFTNVYYNPTQPLGTIWLWPIPNTAQNQLVLYLQSQFTGFADLTTDYTYASVAGYEEALQYALETRLMLTYPVPMEVKGVVSQMARESLYTLKRQNVKFVDLPTDPALTGSRLGGYNIQTGNG